MNISTSAEPQTIAEYLEPFGDFVPDEEAKEHWEPDVLITQLNYVLENGGGIAAADCIRQLLDYLPNISITEEIKSSLIDLLSKFDEIAMGDSSFTTENINRHRWQIEIVQEMYLTLLGMIILSSELEEESDELAMADYLFDKYSENNTNTYQLMPLQKPQLRVRFYPRQASHMLSYLSTMTKENPDRLHTYLHHLNKVYGNNCRTDFTSYLVRSGYLK